MSARLSFVVLLVAVATVVAHAAEPAAIGDADWPQWRGPTRDGQAVGDAWPASLGEARLKLLWREPLGPSYSGPIVVGDRVFTTETREMKTEVVSAYNRNTGKRLWEVQWPGAMTVPFFAASNGSWIRATPACDGETLYVVGMRDVIVALDAATGAERWRIDFPADLETELSSFGAASSPLAAGDAVYAQAGNGLAKIDKRTGEILWRVAQDAGGMSGGAFSSPYLATIHGEPLLIVQTRLELKGIDPESGEERWSQPIEAFRGMNILTPTVYQDRLFTSAHSGRSQLWRIVSGAANASPAALKEVWSSNSQAYMSSPVVVGSHLYLHLRNQRLQCLDMNTGEEAWRSKPMGKYQSFAALGDRILALDSGGELILVRATPDKFDVIDRRRISDDDTWAHVAVCGGQVFVRELNALAAYSWE